MRYDVHYAPPSPSPSPLHAPLSSGPDMILSVILALFLPCVGMGAIFTVYMCMLWYASDGRSAEIPLPVKPEAEKGLSASELDKLPKVAGKELVLGMECAVCLDEIGGDQPARLVPCCNHGFHLECADAWLSKHSVCPLCRTKLDVQFFGASQENPC